MGYVRALRVLHRAFRQYPPSHRLHILIRFLTCPFYRTIDDIPIGARVLDIGSGHGLFGVLIAEDRARQVVAVDPDIRKSLLPTPSPKMRKIAGFDDCIRGSFDAVVLYDVAYHVPLAERRELFGRVFARLAPGGTFVFKDMDPQHSLKMRWTRFQERLNDSLLGLTLGRGFVEQTREDVTALLEEIGFSDVRARAIDRGYPHPHLVYTAVRP